MLSHNQTLATGLTYLLLYEVAPIWSRGAVTLGAGAALLPLRPAPRGSLAFAGLALIAAGSAPTCCSCSVFLVVMIKHNALP